MERKSVKSRKLGLYYLLPLAIIEHSIQKHILLKCTWAITKLGHIQGNNK